MKKIILSIVGVVSLTTGSWGQELWIYPNEVQVPPFTIKEGTTVSSEYFGTFDLSGEYIPQPNMAMWLSPNQARMVGGNLRIYIDTDALGLGEEAIDFYVDISPNGTVLLNSWEEHYSPGGYAGTLSPSWGIAMNGRQVGPGYAPTPTGSGAVIAQAEQLNIGLDFNDGRWTPAE